MRRADGALHDVARLERILLHLLLRDVDVVGRGKVVVVAGAEESVAVLDYLEDTVAGDEVAEVIGLLGLALCRGGEGCWLLGVGCWLLLRHPVVLCVPSLSAGRLVEDVERGQGGIVLDGQVCDDDEVGAVAGVTLPYALVVHLHLLLKLLEHLRVGSLFGGSLGLGFGGLRHCLGCQGSCLCLLLGLGLAAAALGLFGGFRGFWSLWIILSARIIRFFWVFLGLRYLCALCLLRALCAFGLALALGLLGRLCGLCLLGGLCVFGLCLTGVFTFGLLGLRGISHTGGHVYGSLVEYVVDDSLLLALGSDVDAHREGNLHELDGLHLL